MALYYYLLVFKEVYKLLLVLFEVTKDFPKEYKYTLGHNIKAGGLREIGSDTYLKLFHRASGSVYFYGISTVFQNS
jgi:hypothetical protein